MAYPNFTELGRILRDLRQDKEMSLRTLAKELAVSPTYLSTVERGVSECPPTYYTLSKLHNILGGDLHHMCRLAGRIPPKLHKFIISTDGMFERLQEMAKSQEGT